jgi:RNA polymerase sigma-70 factor (ECF subfamily)
MAEIPSAAPFPTAHWSRVVAASDPSAPLAREALAEFCRAYWFPLYAYIRRPGHDSDRKLDLTQDLFVRLLDRDDENRPNPRISCPRSSSPRK